MTEGRLTQQQSKTAQVRQRLYELACEKGPNGKMPTTRDLSEMLQTSQTTLFEALNILEDQDVLLRKQGSGIFVSPKLYRKNFCILLYPHLFLQKNSSPFWGILWGLLAQEASRRSMYKDEHYIFHLMIQPSETELAIPEEIIKQVQQEKLHGIITIGSEAPVSNWFIEHQIPCLAFAGWGKWRVEYAGEEAMALAVSQLVQHNCHTLAFWRVADAAQNDPTIYSLFEPCVQQAGCTFYPDMLLDTNQLFPEMIEQEPLSYQEQGYRIAYEIFGNPHRARPDGIYIDDDMMTWGVLVALQELGIAVGSDLKIVSLANRGSPTLFGYTQKLIILEYDPEQVVQTLFTLLDTVMKDPLHTERIRLIHPTLHVA